ncbi:MAG: Na+:solute symporter [Salibacteraceae bacterium]
MLHWIDWLAIIAFLALSLWIGLRYRKAAGKSVADFFLGGRSLPWYVAGLSMVATTFAADTPLAVAELVAKGGIAGNWLWWSFLFGGALTTFFFASLWQRSGVLTELEFITLRYDGIQAFWLRILKSVYLGLFLNAIIIAWVNMAMVTLLEIMFDLERVHALGATFGLMVLAVSYSTLSGLRGVAVTDTLQFVIAILGCIIMAVFVVSSNEIGGINSLKTRLPPSALNFFPDFSSASDAANGLGLTIGAFLSFVTIQWWASWYPGSEPGGGGYIAQRMMSVKTERDAIWASLLFQLGHYCLRPWPWIIVGLCAVALYAPKLNSEMLHQQLATAGDEVSSPGEENTVASTVEFLTAHPQYKGTPEEKMVKYHYEPRSGFVMIMKDFLPDGIRGLLLVAFIAAYMSTISTQVNWGASYLLNDFLSPLRPKLPETQMVQAGRLISVLVMFAGAMVTPFVTNISTMWEIIMQSGAGLGLVLILRWYWWRVNAWSEIVATITPAAVVSAFYLSDTVKGSFSTAFYENNGMLYLTVAITTAAWIATTYLSKPVSANHLATFVARVKPMGIWPENLAHEVDNKPMKYLLGCWICMCVIVVCTLFSTGYFILHEWMPAFMNSSMAILAIIALKYFLKKTNIFDRN